MADAEGVVGAFRARRKGREATALLDRVEALAPSGQHLVRIGLVPDVPDQAIVRRVEDVMQRHGQFDGAEARGKVPAARRDAANQVFAQLGANLAEAVFGLGAQVGGQIHRSQQREVFQASGHCDREFTRRSVCG